MGQKLIFRKVTVGLWLKPVDPKTNCEFMPIGFEENNDAPGIIGPGYFHAWAKDKYGQLCGIIEISGLECVELVPHERVKFRDDIAEIYIKDHNEHI